MAGGSFVVDRKKRLGWAARLYLPSVLRGLAVTARHFVASSRSLVSGKGRRLSVLRFPEERGDYPDAFRGMPVLVAREDGSPRCVGCELCSTACPTSCIRIVPGADVSAETGPPQRFDIDMSRCIFCGFCEDACPEEAIVMSQLVEIASGDPAALQYDLEALLVPAELLTRRLDFLGRAAAAGTSGIGRER